MMRRDFFRNFQTDWCMSSLSLNQTGKNPEMVNACPTHTAASTNLVEEMALSQENGEMHGTAAVG